jgi:dihydroxyacetone kinase-like predicted kinase
MLQALDAAQVRRWAVSCVQALDAHREAIDSINVYPVPDGDTGSNLLHTMRAALDALLRAPARARADAGAAVAVLARGALAGARGNSGVIVSQFLRGAADALTDTDTEAVLGPGLRTALTRGAELAALAMAEPAPGTMVTVFEAAASAARDESSDALQDVAAAAALAAAVALDKTPSQLAVLADAGVVDAGGRGVVVLFDALLAVVTGQPAALAAAQRATAERAARSSAGGQESSLYTSRESGSDAYAYEVMYLLEQIADDAVGNGARSRAGSDAGARGTAGAGTAGTVGSGVAAAGAQSACGANGAVGADNAAGPGPGPGSGSGSGSGPGPGPGASASAGASADAGGAGFAVGAGAGAGGGRSAIDGLRDVLVGLGDSVSVVGDGAGLWTVHVHCNDIGAAVEAGIDVGRPRQIRVARFADAPSPEASRFVRDRAVVVPSRSAEFADLLIGEGVTVVQVGEQDERDTSLAYRLLETITGTAAAHVTVLPADPGLVEAADEASIRAVAAGQDVVVVPCASPVQVLAAVAVHDPRRRAGDDVVAMAEAAVATRRGEVVVATEAAITWIGACDAGDVLGFADGEVVLIEPGPPDVAALDRAAHGVVERMLTVGGELVTALLGADAPDELAMELEDFLRREHPETELVVYQGGQRDAVLVLGVE